MVCLAPTAKLNEVSMFGVGDEEDGILFEDVESDDEEEVEAY